MEQQILNFDYGQNLSAIREMLRVNESFDIIERHLTVCERDMCFFYIDGFVKDGEKVNMTLDVQGGANDLKKLIEKAREK